MLLAPFSSCCCYEFWLPFPPAAAEAFAAAAAAGPRMGKQHGSEGQSGSSSSSSRRLFALAAAMNSGDLFLLSSSLARSPLHLPGSADIFKGIILPIDFHIFQRGRYTTNQVGIELSKLWRVDIGWSGNQAVMITDHFYWAQQANDQPDVKVWSEGLVFLRPPKQIEQYDIWYHIKLYQNLSKSIKIYQNHNEPT